jgi:tetratricopeptide (TPR) repeat protein
MNKDKNAMPMGLRNHLSGWVRALGAGALLCLLCDALPLSAGPAPSAAASTPVANDAATQRAGRPESREAAASTPAESSGRLTRQLWAGRIAAPDPNEDAETRLALKRLIRQVRSVQFGREAPKPAAVPSAETPLTPAPPRTASPAGQATKPVTAGAAVPKKVPVESSLSSQEQSTLQSLLQDPGKASDPLEIAELLFLSGRPTDAAPFYAQALARLFPGESTTAADRAWVLFQLANCLRETNMSEAQATYAKLIAEYPDSSWTELARAHSQLLSWYQKDRPQQLAAARQP